MCAAGGVNSATPLCRQFADASETASVSLCCEFAVRFRCFANLLLCRLIILCSSARSHSRYICPSSKHVTVPLLVSKVVQAEAMRRVALKPSAIIVSLRRRGVCLRRCDSGGVVSSRLDP